MPSELWEVVRPHDLKVGDVILSADMKRPIVWRDVDAECVASQPDQYRLMRLRRYSGPSPEVLMRAMRLMHFSLYDENLHVPMAGDPQNYIRQAEAEIAAETKGGAT